MSESTRRQRTLTEKGQEEYNDTVSDYSVRLNNVEKQYKAVIFSLSDVQDVELLEKK